MCKSSPKLENTTSTKMTTVRDMDHQSDRQIFTIPAFFHLAFPILQRHAFSTFYEVRETSEKLDLHAGNMEFNTQNEEQTSIV